MTSPDLISEDSISTAWLRALEATVHRQRRALTPMLVSVCTEPSDSIAEDSSIRAAADAALAQHNCYSVAITASMIFPYRAWERAGRPNRVAFFAWYLNRFLPRLKARSRANQYRTYFERMIAFTGARASGTLAACNQLDHIIADWTRQRARPKRPRQSALQVACFDPVKDHTGQAVRGFPCLQQVGFCYDDAAGLAVNAFYPSEYIFDRGYGNYLGLCHLGIFMAHELGLRFHGLNCYVGQPLLGTATTGYARDLCARFSRQKDTIEPRHVPSHEQR